MEHRTEGGVSRGRRDIAVGCLVFAISIGIGIGNGHARRAVRLPLPGADGTTTEERSTVGVSACSHDGRYMSVTAIRTTMSNTEITASAIRKGVLGRECLLMLPPDPDDECAEAPPGNTLQERRPCTTAMNDATHLSRPYQARFDRYAAWIDPEPSNDNTCHYPD